MYVQTKWYDIQSKESPEMICKKVAGVTDDFKRILLEITHTALHNIFLIMNSDHVGLRNPH